MDLDQMQKQLEAANKNLLKKDSEINSILNKNTELLTETKQAKSERNDLKNSVSTLQQQLDDMKNKTALGDENMQKVNDLVAQKIEIKQAEFETALEELNGQLNESQQQYTGLQQKYNGERISSAVRSSAEKAGVIPSAIDDVIARANGVFSVSEEGNIESRDSDGNLMKAGKKVMSPDVFVETLKESAGHLWPSSTGTGAQGSSGDGSGGGVNPFAKETLNYTEQAKISRTNPEKAARLKAQAG